MNSTFISPSGVCADHPMLHNLYLCQLFRFSIPKSNIKIVERGKIDTPHTQIHDPSHTNTWPLTHKYMTPNTQIHDHSHSWIGTGTSIKSGGAKLVLCTRKFDVVFVSIVFVLCFVYPMLPLSLDLPFLMSL
jgi:hypothetical protein